MSELLDGLNERQRAAVSAGLGPVLVLAGPGSGKTRVLTHRIAYLLTQKGVSRGEIMAVTFTNKAAGEMKARVESLIGDPLTGMYLGTFHAICARILRREGDQTPFGRDYVIYDTDDQEAVVKQALGELNLDPKKNKPRGVLGRISAAKNELIRPEDFSPMSHSEEIAARVYERYQAILLDNNALDFDDLLMQTVLLLQSRGDLRDKYQRRIGFLLVDEFQDTNTAQYELVRLIAAPLNNVFVVGDEDQGIYAFRGADYRNVLRFRQDYPDAQVVLLEQNYRSTQAVLDVARAVIDRNPNRTPKALFTDKGQGQPVSLHEAYNETDEAQYVIDQIARMMRQESRRWSDFAVMYRTNAQSRALETECIREGVPYRLVGGVGFYKRREIRDLLAYLRVVNSSSDKVSFARIINVPKRGIGQQSLKDFQAWAANAHISYDDALERLMQGADTPLKGRSVRLFADFGAALGRWRALAAQGHLLDLLDSIIRETGYRAHLQDISEGDEQAIERSENVDELRGLVARAQAAGQDLSAFLAEQMLVSEVDALSEKMDGITLLTLHAAKGLEFPVVFITGLEDGLLPHVRALTGGTDGQEDAEALAEERRLLYVGVTRAEQSLTLSYAYRRMLFGSSSPSVPSRFLEGLPLEGISTALQSSHDQRRFAEQTRWEPKASPPAESPRRSALRDKLRDKIVPFPGMDAPDAAPTRFRIGDRALHAQFGPGHVVKVVIEGGLELVTLAFEDKTIGIKQFDADRLERL